MTSSYSHGGLCEYLRSHVAGCANICILTWWVLRIFAFSRGGLCEYLRSHMVGCANICILTWWIVQIFDRNHMKNILPFLNELDGRSLFCFKLQIRPSHWRA